jgi:hypothetical protein
MVGIIIFGCLFFLQIEKVVQKNKINEVMYDENNFN